MTATSTVAGGRDRRGRHDRRGERGSITPLILGFALVLMLLVTVVHATSTVFLTRRALVAAADGMASAAADSLDESGYYARPGATVLPLDPVEVTAAVEAYARENGLQAKFTEFSAVPMVDEEGTTVTVTCSAVARLPFLNAVVDQDRFLVTVQASARTPVQR